MDKDTGAVLDTFTGFSGVGDLEYDGQHIWYTDTLAGGTVKKFDPVSGTVVGSATLGSFPRVLHYDGEFLWVGAATSDTVFKIDPQTAGILGQFTVTNPEDVTFDGISLWVNSRTAGQLIRVNRDTFQVEDVIDLGFSPNRLISDGINVWYTSQHGEVGSR